MKFFLFFVIFIAARFYFSDAFLSFDPIGTEQTRWSKAHVRNRILNAKKILSMRNRSENGDDIGDGGLTQRREGLHRLALIITASITCAISSSANAEILQVGPCAGGSGQGCSDLSEGNNFIRSLQEKSAEKRDFYAKQALDAYNMKNYPDYFSALTPPRFLVKKPDGSFEVYTENELTALKKAGKIAIEQPPKVMGGKVTDFSQKSILVLKE